MLQARLVRPGARQVAREVARGGLLGVPRDQQRVAGRAGGQPLGVPQEDQRVVAPGGRPTRHGPGGAGCLVGGAGL